MMQDTFQFRKVKFLIFLLISSSDPWIFLASALYCKDYYHGGINELMW